MPRDLGKSPVIVAQYATLFALIKAITENEQQHGVQSLDQLISLIRKSPELGIGGPHDKIGTAKAKGYLTLDGFPHLTPNGVEYLTERSQAVRAQGVNTVIELLDDVQERDYK